MASGITGTGNLAAALNAASVGAPLEPTLRIFSLEPALMRSCLALMLA